MGGMSLGTDNPYGTARRKKKDRHAYHTVEAPAGSSQAFNGIPPAGTSQTAFLNADPSATPGGQFIGGVTPQMNQFPAPVNPAFSPSPASPAEFGARAGAMDAGPSPTFVSASGQN